MNGRRSDPGQWAWSLVFGLGFIGLWYAIKYGFSFPSYLLPAPHEVFGALWEERKPLTRATLATVQGSLGGFLGAALVGSLASLLIHAFSCLRHGLYPFIIFMQMVPIIATAAIIVIWFGVGIQSVAVIAFLIGFFPIMASTLAGLSSVPEQQVELFRLYNANRWQELLYLRVPTALPHFFTGAKIAATLAVIGAVTGEVFAGSTSSGGGLGFMILIYKSSLKMPALFAATLICCLLGFGFVGCVRLARWLCLRKWHESTSTE